MRGFIAIVIVLAAVRVEAQPAPSATTVLANVQKSYAGAQHLSTSFREYVTNASLNTTSTTEGSLWLARPGGYRFDYLEKNKAGVRVAKSVIDDGTTQWVVDHDHRQLIKNPSPSPLTTALAFFEPSDLSAQFNVTLNPSSRFSRTGSVVLELTPKQASAGAQMLSFVVSTTDWRVTESIVIDGTGNIKDLSFNNVSSTKPVHAAWFQVDPSRVHYRVITPTAPAAPKPATPAPPTSGPAGPTP